MSAMNFLESLIIASEKAANIARVCRQDRHLFSLLVQEKDTNEANPRFVHDFKTLADVLIQETLRHDVGQEFSEIEEFIKGEESNVFRNKLEEVVEVKVFGTKEETRNLLAKVLNADVTAATLLAEEVHRSVDIADVNTQQDVPDLRDLNVGELGIWIDPIDSTSEYINGIEKQGHDGIFLSGLRCVTILIGVYNRFTGCPIIGVVNHPFHEKCNEKWRSKCFWGLHNSLGNFDRLHQPTPTESNIICISSSEDTSIKTKLQEEGYSLVEAAGAGYKLLLVILGLADAYILTKDSTFKWDTCAPQAILNSSGGDLIIWNEAIKGKITPVNYRDDLTPSNGDNKIDKYCNRGGVIAYRNKNSLAKILKLFCR